MTNEPRSHIFMLTDHLLVDRAFGGRFQLKSLKDISNPGKLWEVLTDTGKELPQTAKAGNTVCLNCKTTDTILKWPYMGDSNPATDLKRGGNPAAIEMAKKYLENPMGCIHCHDPHAAKARVVRDALIQAVVDRGEGTYPYDKEKSKKVTMTKIEFEREGKPFRAIGMLNKSDSTVLCAKCHVPWFALATGTLATLLPSSPGYVGTFDYFAMLGLVAFGADRGVATAFAVIVHVVLWLPLTVVGVA